MPHGRQSSDPAPSPLSLLLLEDHDDAPTRRAALLAALVIHLALLTLTLPSAARPFKQTRPRLAPVRVQGWRPPPPPREAPRREVRLQGLQPSMTPIATPRFEAPEPLGEPTGTSEPVPTAEIEAAIGPSQPPPVSGPLRPGVHGVTLPLLVKDTQVRPEYPERARRARIQGTVVLEAVVRRDGRVGDIRVVRAPEGGHGFEEASINAVRQWRYEPGRQDDLPVDVYFTIVLDFVLE